MRKILLVSFSLAATFMVSCSSENEFTANNPPGAVTSWTVSVRATQDSITEIGEVSRTNRSLYFGGNNGRRNCVIWDTGDRVYVYKNEGDEPIGYLEPVETGQAETTLTGTLNADIAVNDKLYFYLPSRDMTYSNQDGTIARMSSSYMFQNTSADVTEAKANGGTLSLDDLHFTHTQTYVRFRLQDESGNRLHPTKLQFTAASGLLVKSKSHSGATTYFTEADPLTVETVTEDGEYPSEIFVSMVNDNGRNDTYRIKAWVGEDIYVGPTVALPAISTNGNLGNLVRQVRKTTAATTLGITDIPNHTFTGYAIEPTLEVKDGETTLTLNTDYSVAYTDNTNVGAATATITGLAESGATCTTPYLGTQDKTFNIVQATPVIEMSTTTMTLVNNATQNSQTRTVTRVFIDNNGNGTWDEGTDYDITALCTVTYSTGNDAVATANATSGQVTAAGFGTCTITATVAEAANWTSQTATYTVNVEQEVNGQNSVNPWDNGGSDTGGKIFVE